MHALVIEDDPITAMLIEDELRDLGYTSVDIAETQAEAVAAAGSRTPDLITSDGMLREGTGVAAVQRIWSNRFVPVVFVTGDPSQAQRRVPGAIVVEKPFGAAQFTRAVKLARQGTRVLDHVARVAEHGFRPIYRDNEVNHCPGCGRSHWFVGRATAECAFCATALPLQHAGFEGSSLGATYWDRDILRHGWHFGGCDHRRNDAEPEWTF